jgi:hypothetical protein
LEAATGYSSLSDFHWKECFYDADKKKIHPLLITIVALKEAGLTAISIVASFLRWRI